MRFQDAARDGRAVVYAAIQREPLVERAAAAIADASPACRVMARAVMNGETTDAGGWRTAFPSLFGPSVPADHRAAAEGVLAIALAVADRGEQVRSQVRGAIVEALAERILRRRVAPAGIRRERRILFDGVRAEIHPYDVTVELDGRAEAYDCKWGARGISAEVLLQLAGARANAIAEDERLSVALVVYDARLSCLVRLARATGSVAGIGLASLETLDDLATGPPRPVAGRSG